MVLKLQYRYVSPQCARLHHSLGRPSHTHFLAQPARISSRFSRLASDQSCHKSSPVAPTMLFQIPQMTAPSLAYARHRQHVDSVSQHLQQYGILKINLDFLDPGSQYLKTLVISLCEHHGHQFPISHSASRGWFWDVRPSSNSAFVTPRYQARSETMEEFPWHTDCSYETLPPRYFALHVLQHDRFGGGTFSVLSVQRLSEQLSADTRTSLMRQDYRISIPPEFMKEPDKGGIVASVLEAPQELQPCMMRFRRDLLTPLTEKASRALRELDMSLQRAEAKAESTLHLTSKHLQAGSIIMVNNRRWLHARSDIKDPKRHLRRVRWDAVPLNGVSVE